VSAANRNDAIFTRKKPLPRVSRAPETAIEARAGSVHDLSGQALSARPVTGKTDIARKPQPGFSAAALRRPDSRGTLRRADASTRLAAPAATGRVQSIRWCRAA
jgi:hypothetical protein